MPDKGRSDSGQAAEKYEIQNAEENYKKPSNVMKEIMTQSEKKFISGKIVGYINDSNYKVVLADGRIGTIECHEFDKLIKVRDYHKKVFAEYELNDLRDTESELIKHINQEFYFEVIEEITDAGNPLRVSIDNVRELYLDYIIENKSVVKGNIIQIRGNMISIEIPYNIVFMTKKYRVFGCDCDSLFHYDDYLSAEISVIIEYNAQGNKLYPKLANSECFLDRKNKYIFPSLRIYNGANISRLWLDKNLQMVFKGKKDDLRKGVNRLYIIQNIREKGETKKIYKGDVKGTIPLCAASGYRRNILAVGWLKNLKGYKVKDAVRYLDDNGYIYQIRYQYNDVLDKDTVSEMQPDIKDTKMVPRNIMIVLVVCQGKRDKYILPDFTGMYVETVRKILEDHKIKMKKIVTYEKQENIKNGCITQMVPSAGSTILAKESVKLTVYQEKEYASPFVLRENEFLDIDRNNLVAPKWVIDQICSAGWKKAILEVLLKHKVITMLQIRNWFEQHKEIGFPKEKMDDFIQRLKKESLVGTVSPQNSEAIHFLFPLNNLYELYKGTCYNGKFSVCGKSLHFFKTRCAENQAFFKLCDLLMENYRIKYEVDCIQSYGGSAEEKGALKVHIAVNVKNKDNGKTSQVYFIEAIRFLNDKQVKESWEKIGRYGSFLNGKFAIKPRLLLVFEDNNHYQDFYLQKPEDVNMGYMEIWDTWDSLTNMQGGQFEDIFVKGMG